MGLLDYYRQFEGMSEEEVNRGLRAQAAERRRKALTRVETLDLSQTTWPELAHPSIVHAITFIARRGLQRYPHLRGSQLHDELATRHGVDSGRLILGNGAAELLSSATRALISPGQRLLTSWPSYPLYPIMARRAHGRAVPVTGGVDALLEAAGEDDTRVIALASPNDPTGELLPAARARATARGTARGRGRAARRVARRVRRRPAHRQLARSCSSTTRACSSSAASPRPGAWRDCASATRSAAPARRSCSPSSRPTSASPRSPRRGPWRRCAAAQSCVAERVRLISAERARADRRPARAPLRGHRQPGQLPVGRPPHRRRRRAGRAPGARRRARGRRRRPRRAASRAHRPARRRLLRAPAQRARQSAALAGEPVWRSSAPVVPSRIFRQALVSSCSTSKCSTTLLTRLAEISRPCRSQISR